jgi:hypothetical protein
VAVSVVDATGFELEGVPLLPVQVGRTDTDVTTILHIPGIGLIVAGDVIGNGVRPLHPATVIAGCKDPRTFDTPSEIQSTRRYLTDARRLPGGCTSAGAVLQRHARPAPLPAQSRCPLGCGDHTVPARTSTPLEDHPDPRRLVVHAVKRAGAVHPASTAGRP